MVYNHMQSPSQEYLNQTVTGAMTDKAAEGQEQVILRMDPMPAIFNLPKKKG